MGRERLLKQPIMAPHTPAPRERRVYFLGSSKEARIARVAETQEFNRICEKCREEELKGNTNVKWPPGAIRPYRRPVANAIGDLGEVLAAYG